MAIDKGQMQLLAAIRSLLRPIVDFALPPRCPACGVIVEDDARFCLPCWQKMDFLGDPCCACCGVPFAIEQGEGGRCGACLADPPGFDSARAVLAYGEIARTVAMRLKYGRRLGLARLMAAHMARRLPPNEMSEMILIPVPLHRWRIWSRGFNQAAVIADHIGRRSGIPVEKLALVRHRATRPLRAMNPAQRKRMVRGAFALDPRYSDWIAGRTVILIDDIHTSGATAQECARILRLGKAKSVHLLCWARVLPDRGSDRGDATFDRDD
ncbi:MAG: ComF family protein [Sphingobium sp.]